MTAGMQASPLNRPTANLEALGLGEMAPAVPEYVRLVADGEKDLVTALLELTGAQLAAKARADDDRRMRMANFPFVKTLSDFDWAFQPSVPRGTIEKLATLDFLDRGENAVFVGSPGVGKTHLSVAIGYEAVMARKQVYFADCTKLVDDLKAASRKDTFARRMRFYEHCSLLIIDELGYLEIGREGGEHAVPAREQEVLARQVHHRDDQRAGRAMGRRVRGQRDGIGDRRPAVPSLHPRQDNRAIVPPQGSGDRRAGGEGGREPMDSQDR